MSQNTGNIRLIIFDWAGTTVDFGSRAPAAAFAKVFAANQVDVSDAEARKPMGLSKREHLVAMLGDPSIAVRWKSAHGEAWTEQDVDRMYEQFVPLQLQAIEEHAGLVPNLLDVVSQLRLRGLKLGGTTGYFRAAAEAVARRAAIDGFELDANTCADDVPAGRPAPWMIFRLMQQLGIYPPAAVVKIGDTVADIQAGLAAGCWSIGVCDSSSLTGMSQAEFSGLSVSQRQACLERAMLIFEEAGCHAAIPSIRELPALIDHLNQRSTSAPQVLDRRTIC